MTQPQTTTATLNRFHRSVEAVKSAVRIEDLAYAYTDLEPAGPNRLLGRCPSPEHEDRSPSFYVFVDTQRFKCFGIGCEISGDAVDLEKLCGGHEHLWEAMQALSTRYGVDPPPRSETWRRWQGEKHAIEALAEDVRARTRARRLFKILILNAPEIQGIANPAEKRAEIRRCWREFNRGLRGVSR